MAGCRRAPVELQVSRCKPLRSAGGRLFVGGQGRPRVVPALDPPNLRLGDVTTAGRTPAIPVTPGSS
jgi:hypothetical protein